ncbi:MAG: HEAT repeat domain-containing protein [Polyangiaceae bacterium]
MTLSTIKTWCSTQTEHSPDVIAALSKAARDESAEVRASAMAALGDVGSAEALSTLLAAVEDVDPMVRQMAVQALGQIGVAELSRCFVRSMIRALRCDFRP